MSLAAVLSDPTRIGSVVADGVRLIDEEVASKGGLSGAALKAGYRTVQKVKPGIVAEALGRLLPEFAPRIDPFYDRARQTGDVKGYFTTHAGDIADALLAVTDEKARRAQHAILLKVYQGLRGQARNHTIAAVPRLADLIAKHVS